MTNKQINKMPAFEKVLINIKKADSLTNITKKCNFQYATVHKLIHELEEEKLLIINALNGRTTSINLTPKGKKARDILLSFRKLLSQSQKDLNCVRKKTK